MALQSAICRGRRGLLGCTSRRSLGQLVCTLNAAKNDSQRGPCSAAERCTAASRHALNGTCAPPLRHCKQHWAPPLRHCTQHRATPSCSPCHARAAHVPHMQQRAQWQPRLKACRGPATCPQGPPGLLHTPPPHAQLATPRTATPHRRTDSKARAAYAAGPAVQAASRTRRRTAPASSMRHTAASWMSLLRRTGRACCWAKDKCERRRRAADAA